MARRHKNVEYESPIPDDELALRMSSTAGRKLEKRLESVGWPDQRYSRDTQTPETKPDEA